MTMLPRYRLRFGKKARVDRDRWVHGLPIIVLPMRADRRLCGLWLRLGSRAFYAYFVPAPKIG